MLDRLNELESLRGFQEIDMTPTSVVTSLPTPHEEHASFNEIQVPPDTPTTMVSVLGLQETQIEAPPAPLLKDLDSFTEGTAIGSFDSIPAGPTNELGDTIAPINAVSLSLLPPQDTSLSIELWRAVVYSCEQPQSESEFVDSVETAGQPMMVSKRPRSNAQDEDEERRRARLRIDTPCLPSVLRHDRIPLRPHSAPPG